MKGLLIKDLCNLRQIGKQTVIVAAVLVAWSIFMNTPQVFSMVIVIYCMMLMFTAMSYDEMANFDKYAITLPVTARDLVRTKYVLLLILFGAGLLAGFLEEGISFLAGAREDISLVEAGAALLVTAFLYLMAFEVLLPVMFRLGMEKARLFLVLIFVVIFGILSGGVMLMKNLGIQLTAQLVMALIGAWAALAVAGFFLSYRISVGIVRKKEW